MTIQRVMILGTGLIGGSTGLALRAAHFPGQIVGWDRNPSQLQIALQREAVDLAASDPLDAAATSDLVLLSGPVFAIQDWMEKLAPVLKPHQLVTDVGSVKVAIAQCAEPLFGASGQAGFLPGHPMAGKEVSGAAHADAQLFNHAVWLFTEFAVHPLAAEWRSWVERFGCRTMDIQAARHDEVCAWVSHLPQFVATALSAMLEDRFGDAPDLRAIGGRALREMTRLGASPYSMWRDVAHTNQEPIAAALLSMEQRLTLLRENLKTPELREEFERANHFRAAAPAGK
ncbi:MAG: prephenate dehydrogenase/arogenate dehydrogenase family protein [Acidobacteriaceae bacterium]